MINKKVEQVINAQITREEQSSRIYLAMASWCQAKGYQGSADFLYAQTDEERIHELKFIHYLNDRGGYAVLTELEPPVNQFTSILDVFTQVLQHEEGITASINELYAVAVEEKDYSTANFLQWFITEQIEEESSARNVLDKLNLAGEEKGGLFHIDKELAAMAVQKKAQIIATLQGTN
ncbi:MAG: ferritin [Syntrophothermus sp.]